MITLNDIYSACEKGDVDFIKKFLESDLFKKSNQVSVHKMLLHSSMKNQFGIIKCIWESNEARYDFQPKDEIKELVKTACKNGSLDIVTYLLEQPDFNRDDSEIPFVGILFASSYGNLNIIQYILKNFTNSSVLTMGLENGSVLDAACEEGRLNVVKYFFESPEVKIKFKLQDKDDLLFKSAYDHNQFEILQYFIFDLNLEKNESIKEYMTHCFKNEVDNMFKIRDLKQSLTNELDDSINHSYQNKKLKV